MHVGGKKGEKESRKKEKENKERGGGRKTKNMNELFLLSQEHGANGPNECALFYYSNSRQYQFKVRTKEFDG